ncbi:MAG: chemotaxis protein CheD [Firmicutes bacterium]|nr:chemotaxis protein CheD [Bacillota bacterium]
MDVVKLGKGQSGQEPVADIQVGIADYRITGNPNRLITVGLGSCVGIAFYDPVSRMGGLLHIMLPSAKQFSKANKPTKFADSGIPHVLNELQRLGVKTGRLQVKIAGGAQMFSGLNEKFSLNIGERNIQATRDSLKSYGLKIVGEDVGGNKGRTMILDTVSGQVTIRTVGSSIKVI